jgi:5'-AMP-activated protein kinase catalytic alpha subunit
MWLSFIRRYKARNGILLEYSFDATISHSVMFICSQILKGNAHIPKWLSQGAQDILRKILDPNPITRIDVDGIRAHDWFKQGYAAAVPFNDDEDISIDEDSLHMTEVTYVS